MFNDESNVVFLFCCRNVDYSTKSAYLKFKKILEHSMFWINYQVMGNVLQIISEIFKFRYHGRTKGTNIYKTIHLFNFSTKVKF